MKKSLSPLADARDEFKARWIAYGMGLFNQAEAHGINWRKMPMEELESHVILAEEWSRPPEYQNNPFANQPLERKYHG